MMNPPNTLFPGRPNYTGPTSGWFGLLHHDTLFERSHNVNERIDYVRRHKSPAEIPLRLHNMVYLGAIAGICEEELYEKRQQEIYAVYAKWQPEIDAVNAKWQPELYAVYAKRQPEIDAVYAKRQQEIYAVNAKWQPEIYAVYAKVLAYIRQVMPDCAWDCETCNARNAAGTS